MDRSWSRDQLRAMLEQSTDIIILIDDAGEIAFVNSQAGDVLGYEPSAMVGQNAFDFIHEEDRMTVFERFIELIEAPGTSTDRVQHRMVDADGEVLWVESFGSNRTDTELDGYVINTRNIDEIKQYQAELERQNERLDEFAGVVSHDIRNPLNVARGRLELARGECESQHLDPIAGALDRIEAIIGDVLTLSRAGELVGDTDRVALSSLAQACWNSVETRGAALNVESSQAILADESRLRQLLANLIGNAVEHAGDDVTITIGDLQDGFHVSDDGVGLSPDNRDRVFEAGYSTADGGTGFGLTIVRQIAEAHGWEVLARRSDSGGARFEIHGVAQGKGN